MIGALELAAALLLVAAGVAKLAVPGPAATMLRRAWPRLRRTSALRVAIRAGAVSELAIGTSVAVTGGRWAAGLLALAYLTFAVIAARLARLRSHESCGCFGRTASPVGLPHVALNLVALAAAVAGIVRPAGPVGGLFGHSAPAGVVGLGQAALLAYLGYLSITALPALATARRQVAR